MKKTILIIFLSMGMFLEAQAEQNIQAIPRIAKYWQNVKENIVQCLLCPRKCILDIGQRGVCTVRINKDGKLYTLGYGNPVAVHIGVNAFFS